MYLSTEPDGSYRALKVIAKEQLKSTKNKSKVRNERHRLHSVDRDG